MNVTYKWNIENFLYYMRNLLGPNNLFLMSIKVFIFCYDMKDI